MSNDYLDGVATGPVCSKLRIVGRPPAGVTEKLVVLEEPEEAVQMHWMPKTRIMVPHYRRECPNCDEGDEPKSFHYVGCLAIASNELAILELTHVCFGNLVAGAREFTDLQGGYSLRGLLVNVFRGRATLAQRVLRVQQRVLRAPEWVYHTRRELARIWGIAIKPRIYKEA